MARPVAKLPVVIVETAPAMLATRRASTVSEAATAAVNVTKSLAAATDVFSDATRRPSGPQVRQLFTRV